MSNWRLLTATTFSMVFTEGAFTEGRESSTEP